MTPSSRPPRRLAHPLSSGGAAFAPETLTAAKLLALALAEAILALWRAPHPIPLALPATCLTLGFFLFVLPSPAALRGLMALLAAAALPVMLAAPPPAKPYLAALAAGFALLAALPTRHAVLLPLAALDAAAWLAATLATGAATSAPAGAVIAVFLLLAALSPRPASRPVLIFDGACSLCQFSRHWVSTVDIDSHLIWKPYQSKPAEVCGVPEAQLAARIHLCLGSHLLSGYDAVKRILLFLPAPRILLALFALTLASFAPRVVLGLAALLLLVATPFLNPLGRRLYDLIARHRHRFFPPPVCPLPETHASTPPAASILNRQPPPAPTSNRPPEGP